MFVPPLATWNSVNKGIKQLIHMFCFLLKVICSPYLGIPPNIYIQLRNEGQCIEFKILVLKCSCPAGIIYLHLISESYASQSQPFLAIGCFALMHRVMRLFLHPQTSTVQYIFFAVFGPAIWNRWSRTLRYELHYLYCANAWNHFVWFWFSVVRMASRKQVLNKTVIAVTVIIFCSLHFTWV